MHKNYRPMDDNFDEDFVMDVYHNYQDFSNELIRYPETNRYNNAYGNYRGGYNRSNQDPPLGFGPIGHMVPTGSLRSSGPPFPMHGDSKWRRGYAPVPADDMLRPSKRDKIIKFLLRCGVPREDIINLPSDLLAMMQPMNCRLCAQQFDSNDLSCIHYASKNHLKNLKKWVNQRSDPGSHGKEPLKSRDLYCELCDVHITSVGHAKSHYAGKPHRAIVEGRKHPRNPFLLQPYKQGRLKALVRREMKFLKKLPPASSGPPDPKSADLYCEICQSTMMCSEQMTTHLNGKRHLNKEKQHILRVMKGEVPDDKNKANKAAEDVIVLEDTEEDDDEDEDGEDEGQKGGKGSGAKEIVDDADDGWGEGGEDWKPSAEDY